MFLYNRVDSYYNDSYIERDLDDVYYSMWELQQQNVVKVKVVDELFFLNSSRVEELCDMLIEKPLGLDIWAYARVDTLNKALLPKLKKAGFNWLALGIESGNESIRTEEGKGGFTNVKIRKVVKQLKDNGIHVVGNFMFGFSHDTHDTMNETLNLAIDLNCEHVNFNSMMAYPGSLAEDSARRSGWELPPTWSGYAQQSYDCFPLRTQYLTNDEVLKFRDEAFQTYFKSSRYLSMIEKTFSEESVKEIESIVSLPMRRKIYGTGMECTVEV